MTTTCKSHATLDAAIFHASHGGGVALRCTDGGEVFFYATTTSAVKLAQWLTSSAPTWEIAFIGSVRA